MQGLFEKMKAVELKQKKLREVVDADLRKVRGTSGSPLPFLECKHWPCTE